MKGVGRAWAASSVFQASAGSAAGSSSTRITSLVPASVLDSMPAPSVKVALAQLNVTVGDLSGNADRIITEARRAHALGPNAC